MRLSQFLLLAIFTALATYWMNESFLTGQFIWAGLFAYFVFRNLYYSYRITKFIQTMENSTKRKD